jgi:sugar/nucleoside kinase (ribokinase family)
MRSIVCLGDLALDSYVNTHRRYVGGISFNVAWNLRLSGVDARVVSAVGNDEDGAAVLRTLTLRNVPLEGIAVRDGLTAGQSIIIAPHGERIFNGYRAGVLSTLSLKDLARIDLSHVKALHVPLSDGLEELFDTVAHQVGGITKIADLSINGPNDGGLQASVRRYLPYFDLLCIGGSGEDTREIAELATSCPEKTIILTLGKEGAVCFHDGVSYEQQAIPVSHVVDTTGCGDGFQAAFIAHWLADRNDIQNALRAGAAQGAKIASILGATDCMIDER